MILAMHCFHMRWKNLQLELYMDDDFTLKQPSVIRQRENFLPLLINYWKLTINIFLFTIYSQIS